MSIECSCAEPSVEQSNAELSRPLSVELGVESSRLLSTEPSLEPSKPLSFDPITELRTLMCIANVRRDGHRAVESTIERRVA